MRTREHSRKNFRFSSYPAGGITFARRMLFAPFLTEGTIMPDKATMKLAESDRRQGKAPTTQAGEFVREEFHHVREGKHGARSPQQAIAIGLSKARRAGVKLPPPPKGTASARKTAKRSEEHTSELQSQSNLVCRLLL